MIAIAAVVARVQGVDVRTLEVWVSRQWVRPRREGGTWLFEEIDVARVRLILELRDDLDVDEAAMPVVLSLLDQVHGAQAQVRRVLSALEAAGLDGRVADVLGRLRPP